MNPTVEFLTALGQAFAALSLYHDDHPTRLAALARVLTVLHKSLAATGSMKLSFIDSDVIVGARPLTELRGWEWGARLSAAGIQRLEIAADPLPTDADVNSMLAEMRARLAAPTDAARPVMFGGIHLGPLVVADARVAGRGAVNAVIDALEYTGLGEEMAAVMYLHDEAAAGRTIPTAEVESIVHSLALAIRRGNEMLLPLLSAHTFDAYATTHACNVAMLSIGLSEALGLSEIDARAIGAAALLHDVGQISLPPGLLTKPGEYSAAEREQIERHPVEAARILSARGLGNSLAATVAYEHHIWFNGKGGYPHLAYPRATHYASRIVHVCDIYDALRSERPYREALPRDAAIGILESLSGVELDPEITSAFIDMLRTATELRQDAEPICA